MNKKFRNTLFITFLSSVGLIIAFSIFTYSNINDLIHDQEMVSHTNEVLYNMEQIVSEIREAENMQRGYLLTSNEDFLNEYWGGRERTQNRFDEVKRLSGDNVLQQLRLDTLNQLLKKRFDLLDERTRLGILPPRDPIGINLVMEGMNAMEKISDVVKRMKEHENDLLKHRSTEARSSSEDAYLIAGVFTVLTILIIIT